ncbi:MAG: hypothetical protein ABW278_12750 [Steroidobacteraceae bacterium]
MKRLICLLLLCPLPAGAAADDYKISQLEQAVRTLQRQVQEQSRQLEELRSRLAQSVPAAAASAPRAPAGNAITPGTIQWLDASRWQQLRPGMSELQVIALLGVPTSLRNEDDRRLLLYATEIGATGFLGGSVTLRERVVVAIQPPVLR